MMNRSIAPDRMLRALVGEGLEIGAFQAPQFVPFGKVTYVDLLSRKEQLRFFPEVPEYVPVVDPDVLTPADSLTPFDDHSQDFLIASHLLEHTEDPIGALIEWHRVLKPGGHLYLCLPDQRGSFDRDREHTSLEHLIGDHEARGTDALDTRNRAHYLEWARLVNRLEDPRQAEYWAELLQAVRFPIHFHCWLPDDVPALLRWMGDNGLPRFEILDTEVMRDGYEFASLLRAES